MLVPLRQWVQELTHFDVAEYLRTIGAVGRSGISDELRTQLHRIHVAVSDPNALSSTSPATERLARLTATVCASEVEQMNGQRPTYTSYANIHILEECLRVHRFAEGDTAAAANLVLWRAIAVLLADVEIWLGRLDQGASTAEAQDLRMSLLMKLRTLIPAQGSLNPQDLERLCGPPPRRLRGYTHHHHLLALARLTALPQSTVPDEYLLLRGIHVCETAFWGAGENVKRALKELPSNPSAAALHLDQAVAFTETFIPTLKLVQTIPTQVFATFAETASAAIAADSRAYQLLETHVYGLMAEKRELLEQMPHAKAALAVDTPTFRPLIAFAEIPEISELVRRLETRLFAWKTFHQRRLASGGYLAETPEDSIKGPAYLLRQRPPRPTKGNEATADTPKAAAGMLDGAPKGNDMRQAVTQFRTLGVTVVRSIISPAQVDQLQRILTAIEADMPQPPASFWWHSHLATAMADVRAMLLSAPLCTAIADVMGTDNLWLYEDTVLVKEVGFDEGTPWHQDTVHYPVIGRHVATAWVALDATDESNGAVRYAPGSHRWLRHFEPVRFSDRQRFPAPGFEPVHAKDVQDVISFQLNPGDVVIHDGLTLHGTPAAHINRRRRAIAATYLGDDVRSHHTHFPYGHPTRPRLPEPGKPIGHLFPAAEINR